MKFGIRLLPCAFSLGGLARGARRPLFGALLAAAILAPANSMPATPVAPAAVALAPAVQQIPASPAVECASNLRTEVRLRKLHLVRPDLILYPLAYNVYC